MFRESTIEKVCKSNKLITCHKLLFSDLFIYDIRLRRYRDQKISFYFEKRVSCVLKDIHPVNFSIYRNHSLYLYNIFVINHFDLPNFEDQVGFEVSTYLFLQFFINNPLIHICSLEYKDFQLSSQFSVSYPHLTRFQRFFENINI